MVSSPAVTVVLVARDKFTTLPATIRSLISELHAGDEVLVGDCGYPSHIREEADGIAADGRVTLKWFDVGRFASTNIAINHVLPEARGNMVVFLENDVHVQKGVFPAAFAALESGFCDVAVPIVLEGFEDRFHFNPSVSTIVSRDDGVRMLLKRRASSSDPISASVRLAAHLERHCFIALRETALKLLPLDHSMFCRTDMDLSLQCHRDNIRIAILGTAPVRLVRPIDQWIDREFYLHRWNHSRARASHDRLIEKWRLVGYKSSIEHVDEALELLEAATTCISLK